VKIMTKKCEDKNCSVHGKLSTRGSTFTAKVVSSKMDKSATVTWTYRKLSRKYERFEKKVSKVKVHSPECLNIKEGDMVEIKECRPLSKTKHFVIIKKLVAEK
jgi:small subunit ribosomal protein S17